MSTNAGRTPGKDGPDIERRLERLFDDARDVTERFRAARRDADWHPFIPADYERVLTTLRELRRPGLRFLEWGSANGAITIMADLLGYEACGIEIDRELVDLARDLAARHDSNARFAAGSFLPRGYTWRAADGDHRMGTIARGRPGYDALGLDLADFDLVFGYPWAGEEPLMLDVMHRRGRPGAHLLLAGGPDGAVRVCPTLDPHASDPGRP